MAGLVFGCIVPHPPIIVPEVGEGREVEVGATIKAMGELADHLADYKPETIFIISPHGQGHHDAMGVLTANSVKGNLRNFGAWSVEMQFQNDLRAVAALQEEAKALGIPLRPIGERRYDLDQGVLVPMYFLADAVEGVPLVPLTFSWLPMTTHFAFGQAIRRAAEKLERRVALIASGDLSHRLTPSAPAGYDPLGQVFDRQLVEAVKAHDVQRILTFEEDLVDRAGECGLRSIVILLGALDGLKATPHVLSYEGPFGVGYMVAYYEIQGVERLGAQNDAPAEGEIHPLAKLARRAVETYVRTGKLIRARRLTPEMRERCGVFVSIHKKEGQLRGCIGTFLPTQANVADELIVNAISAATRDPRFFPITEDELSDLEYSVDLLAAPEPIDSMDKLDPKRYGCIVENGPRRGLLLPDLEGVETAEQQVEIACQKAGIFPDEEIALYRFEVRRYK